MATIAVLHGAVAPQAPPDEQDVLHEVDAVGAALGRLGYAQVPVPLTLDLETARRKLAGIRPAVIFNLVESIEGLGAYIHLAPALLEATGLPFTGAGLYAMFETSNKLAAKARMACLGVPTPSLWQPNEARDADRWIVKSVWEHASIGIDDAAVVSSKRVESRLEDCARRWGGARLLSLIKANQADPPPERKGMYTTALRFEGEHAICVYLTGRRHAGENLDAILAHRPAELPPIQWMSDGLAANTPKQHQARTLDLSCLVHGRRQFVDIEDFFPNECQRVIDAIATIYRHEAYCQEHHFTPEQRLAYHQQHSREVMEALKAWMTQQVEERCVEPNSRLGGAFDYLLKRWESLTRFLEIPGAPLDNNAAERALKLILRYRKNSLFYKNAHGAYVGDVLTSLIETCRLAGANPLHYLSALMENRSAVFRDPGAWLPWNYQDNLDAEAPALPLSHPPPVLGQLDRLGVAVPQ